MSDPDETKWLGERLPAPQAAFLNGALAAALDFDSVHDLAGSHSDIMVTPAVLALASRVRVEIDNMQNGKFLPATVRVRTASGAELEATATQLPGTPSNPMPESDLHAKALACLGAGVRPMQHDAARRFAARIEAVDTVTDMREFLSPT
jgi:2-methylcitrate dehydratase PrpD